MKARIGFVPAVPAEDERTSGAGGLRAAPGHLREYFRAEFLARVDRIVAFGPLSRGDYRELLERALRDEPRIVAGAARPGTARPAPGLPDEAVERFLDRCEQAAEGARGFRRIFEAEVLPRLRAKGGRP